MVSKISKMDSGVLMGDSRGFWKFRYDTHGMVYE
jgi:hypothetical protein